MIIMSTAYEMVLRRKTTETKKIAEGNIKGVAAGELVKFSKTIEEYLLNTIRFLNYFFGSMSLVEEGQNIKDTMIEKQTRIFGQIILCFSLYTNTKLLFNTKEGPDAIRMVHGLKFISMVSIIWLHASGSFGIDYIGKGKKILKLYFCDCNFDG